VADHLPKLFGVLGSHRPEKRGSKRWQKSMVRDASNTGMYAHLMTRAGLLKIDARPMSDGTTKCEISLSRLGDTGPVTPLQIYSGLLTG
jgi:hypothetical protein